MHVVDALIVAAFVIYAASAGVRARKRASRNLDEYFLAGRTLSGWQAGASMAATQFAADTPLLVTGLVATAGVFALWRLWIYAIAFLALGYIFAPLWRRARVLTDAELTESRYAGPAAATLRGVKAVYFGTIFNCTVLAMVLFAAKEIAEPFLLWNQWLPGALFDPLRALVEVVGVPFAHGGADGVDLWIRSANNVISLMLIVAVTLTYSATGGLRSVVQTDILQLAVMLVATAAYAAVVVMECGGLDALNVRLHEAVPAGSAGLTASEILAFTPFGAEEATAAVLAVFALQWLVQMNADGTGYLAQRSMACRDDREATKAAIVFTFLQVVLRSLVWLPIALGLLVLYPPSAGLSADALRIERETSFVRGMAELLPVGLSGLMLTAMLAALASTIDSHLNWGASYWTNDLYKRFWCIGIKGREPSPRELVRVARAANVAILAISMAIMTQLSSIQAAWQLSLLLGAGMGVMLVLRWLWWRINAKSEIAAIVASALLAPAVLYAGPALGEHSRLLLVALVSTLAGVAAAFWYGPEPPAVLEEFYRRVKPPGFWGPVAARCGVEARDGTRRLTVGVVRTATMSLAVFFLLVGAGSWLVRSPAPLSSMSRQGWVAFLLVVGCLLIVMNRFIPSFSRRSPSDRRSGRPPASPFP
jgi:Na+/proline symporter